MKRTITGLTALAICALCYTAVAEYRLSRTGAWPKSWPVELEGLRRQARTLVGPKVEQQHHAIRFTSRQEFEAAWPHILSVRSKGSPLFLVRGPSFFLGDNADAGVIVRCPAAAVAGEPAMPEEPIPGVKDPRVRWMNTNYIELVVDGDVIDLNRIPLPADTPIIDERFKDEQSKPAR